MCSVELFSLHGLAQPHPPDDNNLRKAADIIECSGLITGLPENTTAIVSVVMGASLIEEHFTLDRNGGSPDDSFSLKPTDLAALCRDSKTAWNSLGEVNYGRKSSEQGNARFRRSLYFVKDMKAGEVFTEDCVRSVRSGFGLAPKRLKEIVGQKVACDVFANTPVTDKGEGS